MRIGVNLMFMVPGEVGGSEPLLTNLVEAMLDSGHEFTVFGVRGIKDSYPQLAHRTEIVEVPWSSGAQALRIAAENSWLAKEVRRRRLDLIHHGVGTTPFVKVSPAVVTLHDIQYHHFPENFVKIKRAYLKVNVPYSVRHCEVVCVPSEWVKSDVLKAFRVDPQKLAVVPFGSERLFGPQPISAETVRERYRLDRPYFFFPGRSYPHKNHRFLIESFAPVGDAELILTGPPWFRDRDIQRSISHMSLEGRVRHLGHVKRADLAGIYSGAVALVYPSRFEGFGAPVLEAMSVGCPVVSSNAAALPEVVGDAGILLDPLDRTGWTEAMEKLLADSSLREMLIDKSRARASSFSWERSARLQLAAYEYSQGT